MYSVDARQQRGEQQLDILVSEFVIDIENQEDTVEQSLNKIRLCKKEAERSLNTVKGQMGIKHACITSLQQRLLRQKNKTREYKLMYENTLLKLRKSQEQNQRLMRKCENIQKQNDILLSQTNHNVSFNKANQSTMIV